MVRFIFLLQEIIFREDVRYSEREKESCRTREAAEDQDSLWVSEDQGRPEESEAPRVEETESRAAQAQLREKSVKVHFSLKNFILLSHFLFRFDCGEE